MEAENDSKKCDKKIVKKLLTKKKENDIIIKLTAIETENKDRKRSRNLDNRTVKQPWKFFKEISEVLRQQPKKTVKKEE